MRLREFPWKTCESKRLGDCAEVVFFSCLRVDLSFSSKADTEQSCGGAGEALEKGFSWSWNSKIDKNVAST